MKALKFVFALVILGTFSNKNSCSFSFGSMSEKWNRRCRERKTSSLGPIPTHKKLAAYSRKCLCTDGKKIPVCVTFTFSAPFHFQLVPTPCIRPNKNTLIHFATHTSSHTTEILPTNTSRPSREKIQMRGKIHCQSCACLENCRQTKAISLIGRKDLEKVFTM